MNRIDEQIKKIKNRKKIGLMTHLVVGYPTLNHTISLVRTMEKVGVDFIELQIPFSDPICDGPVIMKACENSLKNGTKVKDAFDVMKKLSKNISIPLLFMGYYNNVFKYGTKKFCQEAKKMGVSGLIIPDMPLEEEQSEHFLEYCEENNLYGIRVLSPASTNERLKKNAPFAKGFVYCTSHQGITGVKNDLYCGIRSYLKNIRKHINIPIAVGFGISKREHIEFLSGYANIVVVGSALLNVVNNSKPDNILNNTKQFIKSLR